MSSDNSQTIPTLTSNSSPYQKVQFESTLKEASIQLANKSTLLVTADLVVFVLEGNFPLYNCTALPFHY